jgi:hypothetical protein
MKTIALTLTLTVPGLLVSSCALGQSAEQPPDQHFLATLHELTHSGWQAATPEHVAAMWPSPLLWGSEAHAEGPCHGTATFSYLGNVRENECRHCDTFEFMENAGADGKCDRLLSSVTITRFAGHAAGARHIGIELWRAVSSATETLTQPSTTATSPIGSMLQTATVEVLPAKGGWRVRLTVFRVDADSAQSLR